jgi:hypothetical protein
MDTDSKHLPRGLIVAGLICCALLIIWWFFQPQEWWSANGLDIFGAVGTLIAFGITYDQAHEAGVQAKAAKKEAKSATDAVAKLRQQINSTYLVVNLTTVTDAFAEAKRIAGLRGAIVLPDRLTTLRRTLIRVYNLYPLSSGDRDVLFRVAGQVQIIEHKIVKAVMAGSGLPDDPHVNAIEWATLIGEMDDQLGRVTEILGTAEAQIGRD